MTLVSNYSVVLAVAVNIIKFKELYRNFRLHEHFLNQFIDLDMNLVVLVHMFYELEKRTYTMRFMNRSAMSQRSEHIK